MAEPVVADLIQQQHGLAGGQTHGGADGFVPAAGLEVGHIGSHLLAALPLQDLEYVARQVDAGEVPAAEEGAGQVVDGVDDGGGVGEDALLDADHLVARLDGQLPGQLFVGADGIDLDAVGVGVAAKAADERVILQLLVQAAAQAQHAPVDHCADAAHPLDVARTLHLTQCVSDDGAADAEFGGKVHLRRQTVGLCIAAGAQFLQQSADDAVADDSAAQAAGRG